MTAHPLNSDGVTCPERDQTRTEGYIIIIIIIIIIPSPCGLDMAHPCLVESAQGSTLSSTLLVAGPWFPVLGSRFPVPGFGLLGSGSMECLLGGVGTPARLD